MAEGDEGLTVATGDRRVCDDEGRDLDPAAVVLGDDLFGDITLDVADELLTGRSELGEIVGECRDQSAQSGRRDALLRRTELAGREVDPVTVALDGWAGDLDTSRPFPARSASRSFLPRTLAPVWRRMTVAPSCGLSR